MSNLSIPNSVAQRGSSMIETVVALFVTAIGLLGVQSMQLDSLRDNVGTYLGTEAQLLAGDMIDQILAYDDIASTADNGDFDGIDTSNSYSDPACGAGGCNKAAQLAYSRFLWKTEIENRLPAGQGTVVWDGVAGAYTVSVMWDANKDGNADATYSIQLNL